MLTYESFVNELRVHRAEIDGLRLEPKLSRSVAFKAWNHALSMLIRTMHKNGYRSTGCYVDGRCFTSTSEWSTEAPAEIFNSALDDTKIEIDNVIANYEKYGDPKPPEKVESQVIASSAPPAVATLPKPGELTWAWVRTSVPLGYWSIGVGAIATVAAMGFGAGRMYEAFSSKVDALPARFSGASDSPRKPEAPAAASVTDGRVPVARR